MDKFSSDIWNHIISYLPPHDVAKYIEGKYCDDYVLANVSSSKLKQIVEKCAYDNQLCNLNQNYLNFLNLTTC